MKRAHHPIVILISGRGSNLQAILGEWQNGRLPAEICSVISNNPDAGGLRFAHDAGIPVEVIDHRSYPTRAAFEDDLRKQIDIHHPRLVVLAGFMRILGPDFIHHFEGRLINIHPSLLPDFPGLDTHARAIASGARVHGASAHFVTASVDSGPVIIQAVVPVNAGDTPKKLAERVLAEEHRIYPMAIRWALEDRLTIRDKRVLLDGQEQPEQGLQYRPER